MHRQKTTLVILLLLYFTARATRYAGDFEELGTSARALGMGGAVVATPYDPAAIYYNPSFTPHLQRRSVMLMHSEDFSGLVKHNFLGAVFPERHQALGIALLHNGIPDIKLTRLPNPDSPPGENNRPFVYKTTTANQLVMYLNYARVLSPLLTIGGNTKLIYQDLAQTGYCLGMGIDFGITVFPLNDLSVGCRVRNLSTSPLFWSTGTRELITPRMAIGLAKNISFGTNRLRLAIETEISFEEQSLLTNLGAEYSFRNFIFARVGLYRNNLSLGVGIKFKRFHLDYAFASGAAPDARDLGIPQQISGGVEF